MKKYIDDLDILRAISVIAIVIHHAGTDLFEWKDEFLDKFYFFFNGSFGPDLFFAISGFIIARDLLPRFNACPSTNEWLHASLYFWVKRVFRIVPSAWFWLGLILVLCVVFNSTGVFGSLRTNAEATVAAVLQVANFRFAHAFGNFNYGASFVYWTLSLEEQFYILLPFVAWFGRRYLTYILATIVLFQLLQPRSLLGLMLRTDALLMGVLIAIWSTRNTTYRMLDPTFLKSTPWVGYLFTCGVTICLIALSSSNLNIVPLRWSLIALLCALLVLVASFNGNYLMPPGILKKVFLWVGTRSYAIYLSHIPVFFFTRELMHRLMPDTQFGSESFWVFTGISLALIGTCSELNYRIIEVPLRQKGARVAAKLRASQEDIKQPG